MGNIILRSQLKRQNKPKKKKKSKNQVKFELERYNLDHAVKTQCISGGDGGGGTV